VEQEEEKKDVEVKADEEVEIYVSSVAGDTDAM
jgi:hypothetical protein